MYFCRVIIQNQYLMKNLFCFLLACMAMLQGACSTENDPTIGPETDMNGVPDTPSQPDAPGTSTDAKTLIVYYSYTNNINTIVTDLRTQITADALRVEPTETGVDYAANNYAIGSAQIAAIRSNPNDAASYPSIKTTLGDVTGYERIIVATPLWWSNMAAPMQSFLFRYGSQMAGKRIGLIVSSSSSGISGVESDAKRLIPNGNFLSESLWIRSAQTSNCHALIAAWLNKVQ